MTGKTNDFLVPNDTSWFDGDAERYLEREDFREFSRVAGVDLRELISEEPDRVKHAQETLAKRSVIMNEIRKLHFGYGFPLLTYTHDPALFEKVPEHNQQIDEILLGLNMCDSLRRRHVALSHAILPLAAETLYQEMSRPIVVKNLGSGVGLDTLHLLRKSAGKIASLLNYDTDTDAVDLGKKITEYLETRKFIGAGVVRYVRKSLIKSTEPADLIVKVGVICGLRDSAARILLASDYAMLRPGGILVVTSSNEHMRQTDPLASFLIQHIGTREDPEKGWGLNFRTKKALRELLAGAGFSAVRIYHDSGYPGKEELPKEVLYGCDTLPTQVLGFRHSGIPLNLPPEEVRKQNTGYNWIAVATKKSSEKE